MDVDIEGGDRRSSNRPPARSRDYAWSPDSKWIAYAKPEDEGMGRIFLYSLESKQTTPVTDGWFAVSAAPRSAPTASCSSSCRRASFNPTYGQTEFQHVYSDMSKIYFVTLAKDTKSPLAPRSDEVKIKEEAKPPTAGRRPKPERRRRPRSRRPQAKAGRRRRRTSRRRTPAPATKVDLDGIAQPHRGAADAGRELPARCARSATASTTAARSAREPAALYVFDFDKQTETQLGAGGRLRDLGRRQEDAGVVGRALRDHRHADRRAFELRDFLDLGDLKVTVDRHAEWKQIFDESWRQMRDFFYAPNMHGVDWPAMKAKYAPLVPHVNHRADLTYVIGELIGELNAGHTYVGGGDLPRPARIPMGLLGARLERDPATKFFKIAKILKGQNWDPALRSPLTEIGVNVKEGDFIVAVDGRSTAELTDIWEALAGKAGKQVTLKVNGTPSAQGARDTVVDPDRGRARPLLLQLGAGATSRRSPRPPTAASATCTCPTWACPA